MDILIVAATEREIKPFLESHPTADHLVTGVGSVMTTYHLTRRLHQVDYDLLIQAGVAGAFKKDISLTSVFAVEAECFSGAGIHEGGSLKSLFDSDLWTNDFPFSDGR